MNISRLVRPLLVVASLALFTFSNWVGAEPPMRAARLGYATGTVSFSPAGEGDWLRAVVNRPLTRGDRLWVEAGSRAEVQLGGASIRLGSATSVTLLNIDDRMTQLQLSEGTLKIKVRRMGPGEAFEVDTPNLAFYISRPGEYRIDVDANGDSTAVRVISGRAEAYGEGASYALAQQQGYRFYGTGLSDYDRYAVASWRDDDLDRWSRERERRYTNSPSARYVSLDVVGYEDLDSYGRWQRDPEYGQVWAPTRVSAGWAPFRDGHWSWVDPWGWTWVDDAPWGYAVSHYGRWANSRGTWVWVPGPQRERAVYAPAQVAFVGNFGGASVGVAVGALIGWFALAPREVYQPSYQVSRSYFDRINRSNAVVAPNNITIVYNDYSSNRTTTNVTYANQRVRGGVVAVPATAFRQSQPVAKASVSSDSLARAQVAHVAPVAPEKQSVQGGAPAASAQPTHRERRVVARTAPPPPPPAFAAQQQQLSARPGRPIDEAQRREMKPAAAAPAPAVSVVTAAKPPAAAPPATAPAPKTAEARKADAARADSGRPEGGRGEGRRPEAAKMEAPKGEPAKAESAKADAAKADAAKAEASRKDDRKGEFAKRERDREDARKADAAKVDAAKGDAMKAEAAKAAAARNEAARAEAAKADAVKAEAARIDAAKAAAAKADASRAEAAKAEAARADAMKAEAAKAAAAKADAARADAAKADAARAEAAKADAARAAAAKAEAGRAEAARAEAARAAAAKADAAKADAARAEAAKAQAAQAAAAKAQAAQAEAARAQAAQAAAAKAQAAQAEAAKAQAAQAAAAKAQAAQAEAAKAQAAQAAAAAKATGAQGAAVATDAEKAARKAAREARKGDKAEKDDEKK